MKERPILFSAPMVRALLNGRKTQTRRVVNWQQIAKQSGCTRGRLAWSVPFKSWAVFDGNGGADLCMVNCPYGVVGDRLWVRETFSIPYKLTAGQTVSLDEIIFRAIPRDQSSPVKWTPSIFMPRWASRITLEIAAVRVEQLQSISDADALAEGVGPYDPNWVGTVYDKKWVNEYRDLWEQINGADSWETNPWVWVIEFRRVQP